MKVYGYARVSTKEQEIHGNGLEAQRKQLEEYHCDRIFCDAYTGVATDRPSFNMMLDILNAGDTVVVTRLDRIARSVLSGLELIEEVSKRGCSIHVLNLGLIDHSPTGKMILDILLAISEFDRNMIIERTISGKDIARLDPN